MVKHIISAFFSRGIVALCNLAVLLISAHCLGSGALGQVSVLILNIAVIQTVNEIYTGSSLVYFVPRFSLVVIYRSAVLFSLTCTLFLGMVFMAFGNMQPGFGLHLLCLSFMITLNAFHTFLLLAKEKIQAYNLLVLLPPLVLLLSLAWQVFALGNTTLQAYIVSLYISSGSTLLVSGTMLAGLLTKNTLKEKVCMAAVLRNGLMNQLGNLAHTLSNRLNYYLLGGAALVGVYASATSLIESVLIISASVSPIVLSRVANRKEAGVAMVSLLLAKLCFLLALICIAVLLLIPTSFFIWLLGNDFGQAKTVMLCLSPGMACISFSGIISHYFSGLGRQKILLTANLSGLVVTALVAWPLINTFGLRGAAYAASAAYIMQAVVLTFVFVKQNQLGLKELLFITDWSVLKKQLR